MLLLLFYPFLTNSVLRFLPLTQCDTLKNNVVNIVVKFLIGLLRVALLVFFYY